MRKTLRVWKIKKEASTTAPAKAQFWKVSVAAASWWRFGSEVGPEWSLSWTRRWRLMKKYENSIISWDQRTNRKKVPVAATALTLFHFFNPSNVLSPFWTPKLIFCEVNFQYYWGRVKSHLRRKKMKKRKCHFSISSEHLQVPLWRIEVQSEGESCSQSKIANNNSIECLTTGLYPYRRVGK